MQQYKKPADTVDDAYTERLVRKQEAGWKRLFNVQAPYRWNLCRLRPGFVLDIGCGIGRNLLHVDGRGIGVDHNPHSVATARKRGLRAYTPEQFRQSEYAVMGSFDSLLLSHVAEHLEPQEVVVLLAEYLPLLKENGRIIVMTPQEAGYRSDATHKQFVDFFVLEQILSKVGAVSCQAHSFPFPRWLGHFFKYNEFVVVGILNKRYRRGS